MSAFASWRSSVQRLQLQIAWGADFIRGLTGLPRLVVAVLAGAVSALAFAPVYFLPVICLTLPVLIWLVDGAQQDGHLTRRGVWRAFCAGWGFGFGFFLAGLYWIGHAFLVDAQAFAWMIPFVAVLFPGALALFPALAMAAARCLWPRGWPRIAIFSLVWLMSEYLRGHILTGFPWNLMGYAWGSVLPVLQIVSVIGSYGLSFLTVLGAASFALTAERRGRFIQLAPLGALIVFVAVGAWGYARLEATPVADNDAVRLRVVHAAIEQRDLENPDLRRAIFYRYLALTERAGLPSRTIVIWPEAATPFILSREPDALTAIGEMLPPQTVLITGAPRLQRVGDVGDYTVFNSLHAIDSAGRIIATYDKTHLVPFGEYLPLAPLLEKLGLSQLAGNAGGFTAGSGLRTLSVPGAPPFGPLICYEAIFPGDVTEHGVRPRWLINVTDDSWFGTGAGPRQHFDSARLRAIEEGVPLVRAANKGISAIVDPLGRVVARAPLEEAGVLDGDLPQLNIVTIYGALGDGATALLAGVVMAMTLVFIRKYTTTPRTS